MIRTVLHATRSTYVNAPVINEFSNFGQVERVEEPVVDTSIVLPTDALGKVMELCDD